MSTRWEQRALPVLRALANPTGHYLREGILFIGHGGDSEIGVDLPAGFLHDTVLQLADLEYVQFTEVTYDGGGGATFVGLRITGRGLQVLGQWPRFEALISPGTLALVLEQLADYAALDESLPMKRAAGVIRRIGAAGLRSAAIGVGSRLLGHALGLPL